MSNWVDRENQSSSAEGARVESRATAVQSRLLRDEGQPQTASGVAGAGTTNKSFEHRFAFRRRDHGAVVVDVYRRRTGGSP